MGYDIGYKIPLIEDKWGSLEHQRLRLTLATPLTRALRDAHRQPHALAVGLVEELLTHPRGQVSSDLLCAIALIHRKEIWRWKSPP